MQKLQLSIPEPCHQSWQQMTPTEQGRFCNSCAKEVIDFSTMTDIQVLNYFTNLKHEKVCGRALPEQLNKVISRPEQPKKKLFWYWNYFIMFFMFFSKGNNAKAQSGTKPATEQFNLNKSKYIHTGLEGRVGGMIVTIKKVITGKVTDVDGKPVPFVSISIKGAKYGVAADANGEFEINAELNDILSISSAGYKTAEIEVGKLTGVNIVLESVRGFALGGVIVVQSYVDGVYQPPSDQNLVASVIIKDWETTQAIPHAKLSINKNLSNNAEIAFSDNNGKYKIKGIKSRESFILRIEADGYEPNEFTIDASDFKDRKKEWEVLLKKKETETFRVAVATQKPIRLMGSFSVINKDKGPLYVVDGKITNNANDIKPDHIDNITIMKGAEAMALFGSEGSYGAILITTKKIKVKNLDTVMVTAYPIQGALKKNCTTTETSVMGGMVGGVSVKSTIADSLKMLATKLTGTIKIFPNPVQRGQQLSIALKLKEVGLYQMQITDAAGKIILQKQFTANAKEVTEKLLADSRWASGLYYLSIFDNKNNLTGKMSFIFE